MSTFQIDLRDRSQGWDVKILSAFDLLSIGQELDVVMNADPESLHMLFNKERAGLYRWECLHITPHIWKIQLIRTEQGLGESPERDKILPCFRPSWAEDLNPSCGLFLDIRPLTAKGLDPFQTVIRSTTELKPGQHLQLLLNDPPETFICILNRLGYESFAEIKNGTWNAYFRKGKGFNRGSIVLELDVRRLEPPLPLLKVLESLPSISEGGVLKVLYPNRPDSLVDKLRTHGFEVTGDETEGSNYVLQIWKKKN